LEVPTELRLNSHRTGDVSVVSVVGELDLSNAEQVAAELKAVRDGARVVMLDLRELRFIDTSGLRLVFEERERAGAGGYRFVVARGPGVVQRLFEVAGLSDGLFVDSPDEVTGQERP
jgi:anti-anti-sigma factor